jgi:RHS repeat-associated protein
VARENTCGYGARVSGAMFYNGYRTYDPRVGRYTQGDPIGLDGGWNRFSYVDENPLRGTDPFGLFAVIERGFPREEEALRGHGRNLQALINKMCPAAKKILQPIFDRWNVDVDPNSQGLRRNRSDYALTDYANQSTRFYSGFNALSPNMRKGSAPAQSFVFRHESRHLMKENHDLYDRNSYLRDALRGGLEDHPAEKDADDFARKLMEEYCPCQ